MTKNVDLAELPKRLKYLTPLVRVQRKHPVIIGGDIHYFSRVELEEIEQQCSAAIKIYEALNQ